MPITTCKNKHCVACGVCATAEVRIRGEWEHVCPNHLMQTTQRFTRPVAVRNARNILPCLCGFGLRAISRPDPAWAARQERIRAKYHPRPADAPPPAVRPASFALLLSVVSEVTGLPVEDICGKGARRQVPQVNARMLLTGFAWVYTDLSFVQLGRLLQQHHTTVMHARNNFLLRFIADADTREAATAVRAAVQERSARPLAPFRLSISGKRAAGRKPAEDAGVWERMAHAIHEEDVAALKTAMAQSPLIRTTSAFCLGFYRAAGFAEGNGRVPAAGVLDKLGAAVSAAHDALAEAHLVTRVDELPAGRALDGKLLDSDGRKPGSAHRASVSGQPVERAA